MKSRTLILVLAFTLLLFQAASAMSSPNYRIDWMVPLTGGGGTASSPNYIVDLTVGQSATGPSSSANYRLGLGFWHFSGPGEVMFLPLVIR